eukprot:12725552-Prorocentrum_lima.AAC.1
MSGSYTIAQTSELAGDPIGMPRCSCRDRVRVPATIARTCRPTTSSRSPLVTHAGAHQPCSTRPSQGQMTLSKALL